MKIKLHPFFIILLLIFIYFGLFFQILIYFFAIFLHELGHYFIAKRKGYKLYKLFLQPYGVCLSYNEVGFSPKDEIHIAIAGPMVNLFICILLLAIWWIFPSSYDYLYYFCVSNFVTFIFNMLPCFPLDGGRVFTAYLTYKFDKKLAIKTSIIINIIFSIFFLFLFIISIFISINFNFLMISIFIFSGILDNKFQSKYEKIIPLSFFRKKKNNALQINAKAFSFDTTLLKIFNSINKRKFNLFLLFNETKVVVLNENKLMLLMEKYDWNTKLSSIIK